MWISSWRSLRALSYALWICAGLSGAETDDFAKHLRAGSEEAQRGQYGAALAEVQAALRLAPNDSSGWQQMGLLLGQLADFRGAETAFRRAVQLAPASAEAHYNLGLTLVAHPQSKLDWPGAIREFREALKDRPAYPEALNLLGAGLSAQGDDAAAIPELESALRLNPSLAEAHFNLGICFEKQNRDDEAAKEYGLAQSSKHDYPEASTALGKLLFRTGKPADAEQVLEQALRVNPDLADAHYALARVFQTVDKPHEAEAEFAAARQLAQRKTDAVRSAALSNQGLGAAAKGDLIKAVALLRQAVALKPDYGVPHHNLGLLLADTGEGKAAAEELVKAASLLPGQATPWYDLGRVLRQQGDLRGALQALRLAARMAPGGNPIDSPIDKKIGAEIAALMALPDNQTGPAIARPILAPTADTAEDHASFAAALSARNDQLGAAGELLRALALQPARLGARRDLAAAYARLSEPELAAIEYVKALRIAPDDGLSHREFGKLLLDLGDAPRATAHLRDAVRLLPRDTDAQHALQRATARKIAP